ncbi:MAG TPA: cation:proton antiporter [Candidatus Limnocylindria bacterium]|jgi:CPA2 family monovalent cation:H+ antiporter-2|nr:cation:proton antiporter [Candidatus Limnocylindria bacterium]
MTGLGLTLLVALIAALALGAVAHRLRLPPMLGYIAAGIVVGPATPGVVANRADMLALADIGVALLMFSIGLQFSIGELRAVGPRILAGAPLQVLLTMGLGTGTGLALGWPLVEALFVGGAVAVCSTVVLVKLAGETALHVTTYGRTAIGVSIVHDLVTILLVVLLAATVAPGTASPLSLATGVTVAIAFVTIVVFAGSRLLPRLLAVVAQLRSRELFVISVAVIAIGTAFAAQALGVSVALGAFVAGLALADSDLTASVLGEIVPLRELFASFFFVSIGILLEPAAVLSAWPVALALVAIITLGKAIPIGVLALLDGQRPGSAARAGALVGQSGEFSFVLASVGLGAGAVTHDIFSLAMGAVVISILLAQPLYSVAGRIGDWANEVVGRPDLPGEEPGSGLRRHAVILGYGRVGRAVARVLQSRGFSWVAVDGEYAVAREARAGGAPVIYGEAGTPSVLDQARIADCHALVVAIPDALATRQAVLYALGRNPRIEIVARAHSEAEEAELRRMGVARVVVAERELGTQLVRHALRRFGVSDREVAAIIDGARRA